MPNTFGPGGPGSYWVTGPDEHPLLGLPRPTGDVATLRQVGHAYESAGPELGAIKHRVESCVSGVVGDTWVGSAGSTCQQATSELATAYGELGAQAHDAQATLLTCATKWEDALQNYDSANKLAGQALEDESQKRADFQRQAEHHRAAGDEIAARLAQLNADGYLSPLRQTARDKAIAAIRDYDTATQQAAGALDSALAPVQKTLHNVESYGGKATTLVDELAQYDSRFTAVAKGLGWATGSGAYATEAAAQVYTDLRMRPGMEVDERIGRAVVQAGTVGLGAYAGSKLIGAAGSALGRGAGALVGSAIPIIGTKVGAAAGRSVGRVGGKVLGGVAGGYVTDRYNDWFVRQGGNFADEVGDRLGNLGPWDEQ